MKKRNSFKKIALWKLQILDISLSFTVQEPDHTLLGGYKVSAVISLLPSTAVRECQRKSFLGTVKNTHKT